MKKGIGKTISIIAILTMTFQLGMPIIPMSQTEVLATNETTVEQQSTDEQVEVAEEISRDYEIKDEETWDVSKNGDGSVIAKWTLHDKTLKISGTGKMQDWDWIDKEDWSNTQYETLIEKVIIEDEITSIGEYAFYGCSSLKSVNIPESVTNIGRRAFFGCSSLENINVDTNNKNYISENGILFNKGKTKIVKYPEGKEEKGYIIPNGVTDIEERAFVGCNNLIGIEIPESVTSIGESAFSGCSSLESIIIPEGVTSIGYEAFYGCSSLKSIDIPEGVTNIGDYVFDGCSSLESINVNVNNKNYISEDGILFNKEKTEIIQYPSAKSDIEEYTIPSTVTSIRDYAFYDCNNLINIIIPEGITDIGRYAFVGCENLKSVTIPSSVTSIGYPAFPIGTGLIMFVNGDTEGHRYAEENEQAYILESEAIEISTNYEIKQEEMWDISANGDGSVIANWNLTNNTLTISGVGNMKDWNNFTETEIDYHNTQYTNLINTVVVEVGVTNIGSYAFYKCKNLKNINISNDVIDIGINAFDGCSTLESIILPERVTAIQFGLFSGCSSLTSITIPEMVESVESYAFHDCGNLTSIGVDINNKNYISENGILFNKRKTKIVKYPEGKEEKEYVIPNGVTDIEKHAFSGCNNLISIEIPDSITSIGYSAFDGCSSLESIEIPYGVTSIQNSTFWGCSSLTNVTIPNGVTSIGWQVFTGCSSLTSINIPESVTDIEITAFWECDNLESLNVDTNNQNYLSENGVLFNKEKTKLIRYLKGKKEKEYTVPNTVTSIGEYAFYECNNLINVKLPDGITTIESFAFRACNSLQSINIPTAITNISDYMIYECTSLISIEIPDNVTSIGEKAFYGCSSLQSITIPREVTKIREKAIPETTIIYTKIGSEAHRYAEENQQGYILTYETGDIDGNGMIDITDFLMLKRHLVAGSKTEWILTGKSLLTADMNENGNIDVTDMLMLKRKIANNM